jgi:hypothetical protein
VATPASNPKRAIQFGCEPNQLQIPNNSWGIQHKTGIKKKLQQVFLLFEGCEKTKTGRRDPSDSAASIHLPRAICRTEKEISKLRMQSFERKQTRLMDGCTQSPGHPLTVPWQCLRAHGHFTGHDDSVQSFLRGNTSLSRMPHGDLQSR